MRFSALLLGFLVLITTDTAISQSYSHTLDQLLQTAREEGSVRVIVELDISFQPEAALLSDSRVAGQYAQIAETQQDVLESLATRTISNVRTYETVPYLALTVDEAGLLLLTDLPNVRAVHEDRLHKPSLDESTHIIGAPSVWGAGYTGAYQAVALLDTGVDSYHPFLDGRTVDEA